MVNTRYYFTICRASESGAYYLVSEKILDPEREMSADIIRLGTDLAELKRQLEFDEQKRRKLRSKPSSYESSTMNSEKSRTSNETTVDRRNRFATLKPLIRTMKFKPNRNLWAI